MAACAKPFSPKEARGIVESQQKPAVFLNMTCDWPGLHWNVDYLSQCLGESAVRFRIGKRHEEKTPLFETQCPYIQSTLGEFLSWTSGHAGSAVGPFSDYPLSEYWAYADYKYIAVLFQDKPSMFEDVPWSDFGYPGRSGRESTLWIGTDGANTPCHLDSYGCNLVFQVQGRKRWHLFPPEDTPCLYPTRIPYEESSVFSQVNVVQPDLGKFPAFKRAKAHVVTLEPGQVLFVPRQWWHYVESVDAVTVSVNSWIEMEVDDEARVGEALTKTIVCALKTTPSRDNKDHWLNPTEEGVASHSENVRYLNLGVQACMEKRRHSADKRSTSAEDASKQPAKRGFGGRLKTRALATGDGESMSFTSPFGPNLRPVDHDTDPPPKPRQACHKATPSTRDGAPQLSHEHVTGPQPITAGELGEGLARGASTDARRREEAHGASNGGNRDGPGGGAISTNDMLECLVHPDIIAMVTQLLMDRQRELGCG